MVNDHLKVLAKHLGQSVEESIANKVTNAERRYSGLQRSVLNGGQFGFRADVVLVNMRYSSGDHSKVMKQTSQIRRELSSFSLFQACIPLRIEPLANDRDDNMKKGKYYRPYDDFHFKMRNDIDTA